MAQPILLLNCGSSSIKYQLLDPAEPGPRALLATVQQQSWFVPLFHHWLELESRVGVHGVRMTALGWFDFRSAWLRPEPTHQPAAAP